MELRTHENSFKLDFIVTIFFTVSSFILFFSLFHCVLMRKNTFAVNIISWNSKKILRNFKNLGLWRDTAISHKEVANLAMHAFFKNVIIFLGIQFFFKLTSWSNNTFSCISIFFDCKKKTFFSTHSYFSSVPDSKSTIQIIANDAAIDFTLSNIHWFFDKRKV